MKTVSIFGATGSVGQATADVIAAHPEKFSLETVSAHTDAPALADTARRLKARRAVIADEGHYHALKDLLRGTDIEIAAGRAALIEAAKDSVDLHIAAIVGMAGLEPLMAALHSAKAVAIANKEPLVAAGHLVKQAKCPILPVDSEHNAIFQVLDRENRSAVDKLILTASGGPFRTASLEDMAKATPDQALAHPNWRMGAKISIDSATMTNKALEIIEAYHLFDMPAEKIEVIVHPQSIIHSMVEYVDGSVLAQMGAPDMRTPIAYCLGWPERITTPGQRLDTRHWADLTFEPVDHRRFPVIKLAYDVLEAGAGACLALNAANEIAVEAFLAGQIGFLDIGEIVQKMVQETGSHTVDTLDDVLELDREVRNRTSEWINQPLTRQKQA